MADRRFLDVIDVKDPCPESWAGMRGDGPVRFCGLCRMNVYNLSAMTREEAERTVREREGRLCVRFYRRRDGTVVTSDCAPIRFAALRRAARRTMTGAAALLVTVIGLVTSLGLFRLFGADLAGVFAPTPVGTLAKKVVEIATPEPDPIPMMGAPPPMPEDWEMGEAPADFGDLDAPSDVDDPAVERRAW